MFTEYTTEIVFTIIQYGAESINTGVNPTTDSTFGQGCHQDLPEGGGGEPSSLTSWSQQLKTLTKVMSCQKDEECKILGFFYKNLKNWEFH